jgi:O-acetyl-ADP-ribose deacetylase (regulator of RNase III)
MENLEELFSLLAVEDYDVDYNSRLPFGKAVITKNQFNRIKLVMQLVGKVTMNADTTIYALWGDHEVRMYKVEEGKFDLIIYW